MKFMWEVPDKDFVKINVYCVISELPMPNGNTMGVASIIRNELGEMLWGCLGPLTALNEEHVLLTALQAACIHANKKEWDLVHIETINHRVFDTLRLQQQILLDDDQLEVYSLFNTLHANSYKVGKSKKCVTHVPLRMNGPVEYMAIYGWRILRSLLKSQSRLVTSSTSSRGTWAMFSLFLTWRLSRTWAMGR